MTAASNLLVPAAGAHSAGKHLRPITLGELRNKLRTSEPNPQRQRGRTWGARLTDACCVTAAGKLITCTGNTPTCSLGFVVSHRMPPPGQQRRIPPLVAMPGTVTGPRFPFAFTYRPASPLRRFRRESLLPYHVGETKCANPWRWSCRRRPPETSSKNARGPPL